MSLDQDKPTSWDPGIDWENSLTRDLKYATAFWEGAGSQLRSLVYPDRDVGTLISGARFESDALRTDGDAAAEYVDFGSNVMWDNANPNGQTVMIRFKIESYSDTFIGLFALASSTSEAFTLFASTQGAYQPTAFGTDTDSVLSRPVEDFSAELLGQWTTIIITWNGLDVTSRDNYSLFRNGRTTVLQSSGNVTAVTSANQLSRAGGTTYGHGLIDTFCVWDRGLSEQEAIDLSGDPYQFFRDPDMVPLFSAGVSAPAVVGHDYLAAIKRRRSSILVPEML